MPWTYAIKPELNLLAAQATGLLTEADLAQGTLAADRDPKFHSDLNGFYDFSGVTEWKVSGVSMASLASERKFSAQTKTAILVQDDIGFDLARIYQTWADRGVIEIFTARSLALVWLNQPKPPEQTGI